MKKILYSLTSDLHAELTAPSSVDPFIRDIESCMACNFEYRGEDFSNYGKNPDDEEYIFVRSGGTEGKFLRKFASSGTLSVPGGKPVKIITSGQSNSLAASMEIISYLNRNGYPGKILHGTPSAIVSQMADCHPAVRRITGTLNLGIRLGVVGHPSDWLISSDVDYAKAAEVLGVELVDVPMEELISEMEKGGYEVPEGFDINLGTPLFAKAFKQDDREVALKIYGALCRIVEKYGLSGFTLRCFDLLTAVRNTGCLALAIFNSRGIPACCEGDVPALLSMVLADKVAGTPGFQANLSRISGDRYLFAHCTVPFNIVKSYCFDTHFESGMGVAVHGEFKPGPATIFKIGAALDSFMAEDAVIESNQYENNLCRTQIFVKAAALDGYFLANSLGNHHIIIPGLHAEELKNLLQK